MSTGLPEIHPLGDAALILSLGETLDPAINARVHALNARIAAADLPGLRDRVPAYASLTLHYDPLVWRYAELRERLRPLLDALDAAPAAGRELRVPVCYGGDFGPDLTEVARHARLSPDAVIARHTAAPYRVFFLGFSPGFPYLGGLDPALATPRRATPRAGVPAGTVGIAGAQTGIYPQATPGGWQLIGRTPLRLFDPLRSPPCLLAPGDSLRFVAVDAAEFARLEADA